MSRFSRLSILALGALLLGGCSELLAPVFGVDVELRGMDWELGAYQEARSYTSTPAGFLCEPVLRVRAHGGTQHSQIAWVGAVIETFDASGASLGATSLNARDVERLFGSVSSGRETRTDPIPVVAQSLPFTWKLKVHYYEEKNGFEGDASFSAACLDTPPGA